MASAKDLDLYGILKVDHQATKKEIVKAYRKQALKCHPDKNPDNPKAAELFHELTKALEILTDEAARAAYDKTLKAKKAAELRHKELDSKRKKFKEDLEAREEAALNKKAEEVKLTRNLQEEIERLRKEGSRLVEEEQERLEQELKEEKERQQRLKEEEESRDNPPARLKVRWKAKKSDTDNGGYTEKLLNDRFSLYGEVTVLVSKKKNGSAVVEFPNSHAAIMAIQNELGLPSNPLTLSWLSGQPAGDSDLLHHGQEDSRAGSEPVSSSISEGLPSGVDDFESLVLRRLRQAEERRRLEEQIKAEDGES